MLQDVALRHVRPHDEVGGHAPRRRVDAVGSQHDHAVPARERGDEGLVEREAAAAEHGTQRDVEHAFADDPLQREVHRFLALVHRWAHVHIRVVEMRQVAGEQARGVDQVQVARVEDPVAQVGGNLDAEACRDRRCGPVHRRVARRIGRQHRMGRRGTGLEERLQAGEHGQR